MKIRWENFPDVIDPPCIPQRLGAKGGPLIRYQKKKGEEKLNFPSVSIF